MQAAACLALCLVAPSVRADAPVLQGPYSVEHQVIHVPGLQISSHKVDCYFASNSTAPQRFIAFGHGASGGQFIQPFVYKSILTALASWGFVVGAPRACLEGGLAGCKYYKQQLTLIDWARKAGAEGHSIMKLVNFTGGVGIGGHSMGGGSTLTDSTAAFGGAAHGIAAAVMLHAFVTGATPGGSEPPSVPFLAFTGTRDTTAPPAMTTKFYGAAAAGTPRGLVNKVGATHQEPTDYKDHKEPYNPRLAQYMAAWYKLYVDGWTAAPAGRGAGAPDFPDFREMIFGKGADSLCGGGDGDMETCEMIDGN